MMNIEKRASTAARFVYRFECWLYLLALKRAWSATLICYARYPMVLPTLPQHWFQTRHSPLMLLVNKSLLDLQLSFVIGNMSSLFLEFSCFHFGHKAR
ncbi:hypothetical protein PsorP6_001615 [Peronosclerospora sorghi]|uniref:Uncharacterized protein n=1 Tax=Peronosclerospora sorghi TaxID=230839 RepID=A0ACC0WYH7_9STRA|nr:hypothetical protein PsorP6_001615 [Peronosclerospora sorghi]